MEKISVIIPIKNNLEITQCCLDSLKNYTKPSATQSISSTPSLTPSSTPSSTPSATPSISSTPSLTPSSTPRSTNYELIIVNDGSDKETTDYLKSIQNVKYIYNEKSIGWVKSINLGIKQATGKYVCFSNNDVVFTPNWVEKIVKHFENDSSLGIISPKTNHVDSQQHIDYDRPNVIFQYVDTLAFFCVVVKKEVIDAIGMLDENFGLGGQDDTDYCIRAKRAGYKVGVARNTFIYHYGSATFREEFKNDIAKSKKFADSRLEILKNKYNNSNKKKVFIAIPNMGNIAPELSILTTQWSHDERYQVRLYMPRNVFPLDNARNAIVKEFLELGYDYLFWIDSDIIPPVEALHKMIEADKDVIGAVCFSSRVEGDKEYVIPVTLRYNENKQYAVHYSKGIEEVDCTGGACVMVKRSVYEKIERPYEFTYHKDGTMKMECDFIFCQKLQKKKIHIFIDYSIICDHKNVCGLKGINNMLVSLMVKNG